MGASDRNEIRTAEHADSGFVGHDDAFDFKPRLAEVEQQECAGETHQAARKSSEKTRAHVPQWPCLKRPDRRSKQQIARISN